MSERQAAKSALAAWFETRGRGRFRGAAIDGCFLPRLQDWIMPYLPETATVYHRDRRRWRVP